MVAWIIVALAVAAAILLVGIGLGYSFAQTNPSNEHPIPIRKTGVVVPFPRLDIRA